jgi:hypothetical protein
MTAIGNHEASTRLLAGSLWLLARSSVSYVPAGAQAGYSASFYPGADSGGECGVPYNALFPFACQDSTTSFSRREPWYSFDYGNAHFVVMSTEHDFTRGTNRQLRIAAAVTGSGRRYG